MRIRSRIHHAITMGVAGSPVSAALHVFAAGGSLVKHVLRCQPARAARRSPSGGRSRPYSPPRKRLRSNPVRFHNCNRPAPAQVCHILPGVAGAVQLRDEGVVPAAGGSCNANGVTGKVRRLCESCGIGVAVSIHRNAGARIALAAAQIGAICQRIPGRGDFGHERVVETAAKSLLRRCPVTGRPAKRRPGNIHALLRIDSDGIGLRTAALAEVSGPG
jgi:hypothetical protein